MQNTDAIAKYEYDAEPVEQYIESMENNREAFAVNIESTTIDEKTLAFFRDDPVKFLVVTEDWCVDSVQFVPVLVKLAREIPEVEVRILRRDEHRHFAGHYPRKDGYQAIPVIIVLNQDGIELGALIERPEQASEAMAAETRRFQEANPELEGIRRNVDRMPEKTRETVKAHSRAWRGTKQEEFAELLLQELRQIIERGRKSVAA